MWCKKKRRKKRRRRARRTWILERGCEQSYWLRRRNMNLKVILSSLFFLFLLHFFLFLDHPFPPLLFSLSLISSPPNTAPKKPAKEAKDDDDSDDDDDDDSDDEAPTGSDGKPKKEVDEIYRRKESKLFFKKQSANFAQKRNTGKLSEKSVSPPLLSSPFPPASPHVLPSSPLLFSLLILHNSWRFN